MKTIDQNDPALRLLPRYFKVVASSLLLISLAMLYFSYFRESFNGNEMMKNFSISLLHLSLLMFMMTKDKIEDELSIKIRLQSLTVAFLWGSLYFIIHPFVSYVFDIETAFQQISTNVLLLEMYCFYFIFFFLLKRKYNEK